MVDAGNTAVVLVFENPHPIGKHERIYVMEDIDVDTNVRETEGQAFQINYGLENALKKAWDEITSEELIKIVDNFPKRLRQCIAVQGGHFEN